MVNVVTGYGKEVGEALITHPKVAKVAFTGGSASGRHVYSRAAESLKKVSLVLGGKSPNIVFDDAKLENAVKGAISGIFAATGQTCIAGSRLLVQKSIHDEFVDKLVAFAQSLLEKYPPWQQALQQLQPVLPSTTLCSLSRVRWLVLLG